MPELDFTGYGQWVWRTVALLPIAWDYSLLLAPTRSCPCCPGWAIVVWPGRPFAAALAGTALALSMVPRPDGSV